MILDVRTAPVSAIGWYGAALELEDFYTSLDVDPISSVPLQFLIHVQDFSALTACTIRYELSVHVASCAILIK